MFVPSDAAVVAYIRLRVEETQLTNKILNFPVMRYEIQEKSSVPISPKSIFSIVFD